MRGFYAALMGVMLLAGCGLPVSSDASKLDEPMQVKIACYRATSVDYRRPGKPFLKVHLDQPNVVAVASQPLGWGYHQFPTIARWEDGTIAIHYHLAQDAVSSYGKEGGTLLSGDDGRTWAPSEGRKGFYGTSLPNGDRINITTPKAYKVSEIKLPEPVGKIRDTYHRTERDVFRLSDLSPELRNVRLDRLPKGSKEPVAEQAELIDPQALRYTIEGLFPIVWWGDVRVAQDGSLLAGIYPGLHICEDGTVDPTSGVFFYRSTDFGRTWTIQGRILYLPDLDADPKGNERQGFTEPAFEILADGSLICVMRTTDGIGNGPMYYSRSTDLGRTWSKPVVFAENGVLPKLLRLENGVLVLASGRPGVQLRFNTDGKGENWSDPFDAIPITSADLGADTCGYTSLIATSPNSFLMAYSHFKHINEAGQERKAILVREVQVSY